MCRLGVRTWPLVADEQPKAARKMRYISEVRKARIGVDATDARGPGSIRPGDLGSVGACNVPPNARSRASPSLRGGRLTLGEAASRELRVGGATFQG